MLVEVGIVGWQPAGWQWLRIGLGSGRDSQVGWVARIRLAKSSCGFMVA